MNAAELIGVRDLCTRLNLTERRAAFLIKHRVLIPEVITRDGLFFHRRNIRSIRETVQKFSGV